MKKILLASFICFFVIKISMAQSGSEINGSQNYRDTSTDKTLLVTLKIRKASSGITVTLVDKKIVAGTLKQFNNFTAANLKQDDLLFIISNGNHAAIDTFLLSQPLTRRYEYPGDNGVIGTKTVQLDETEIVVRSKYNPAMKYAEVETSGIEKKSTRIATLPL